jgi:hypothetical protein
MPASPAGITHREIRDFFLERPSVPVPQLSQPEVEKQTLMS